MNGDFAAQIGKFNRNTKDRLQQIRRGVAIKLFSAVIMSTPVLSGRLRGNWRFAEGAPELKAEENVFDKEGLTTIQKAIQGIELSTGEVPIYLTNSLPYAARIEFDGWSHTKAPEGMVRINVARFNTLIRIQAAK